jgi:periplasmic divalent cation tolerance protein
MSDILLVFCTCPDRRTALDLTTHLVEKRLAACVNISAPITSVYRWQGKVERSEEYLLSIKTSAARYTELEQEIRKRHPYELPEIIAVPIEQGLTDYLKWVEQCTNAPR